MVDFVIEFCTLELSGSLIGPEVHIIGSLDYKIIDVFEYGTRPGRLVLSIHRGDGYH